MNIKRILLLFFVLTSFLMVPAQEKHSGTYALLQKSKNFVRDKNFYIFSVIENELDFLHFFASDTICKAILLDKTKKLKGMLNIGYGSDFKSNQMVMGTGWIIDGIWNYFASFYGHACLWMGDGRKAAQSLYAFANHASPLLAWREEHNPRDLERHFVGDMPHNWASAEFVRLAIHLLAIDRDRELHFFEGLPEEWARPGMETALQNIATPYGQLKFSLKIDETGKTATLNIDSLSDKTCEKIVVHLDGWATKEKGSTLELDPKSSHSVNINIE